MAGASVLFLGTGDAFCNGGRLHTAFHVAADGYQALIDCGATTIAVMRHLRMDVAAIDAIVVSHLHGDHFGGIPFLLMDACYNAPRTKLLTIVGTGRDTTAGDGHARLPLPRRAGQGREPAAPLHRVQGSRIAGGRSARRPADSGGPSERLDAYGLRLSVGGRVVAFSGDTAWTPALAEIAKDADLFICECTGYDTPVPSHLHYRELQPALPELQARRTVLTHLGASMLARLGELEVEVAEDGQTIQL